MISREQIVEQSIEHTVRKILDDRGYTDAKVGLVDSFPYKLAELDKTYVAAGFNFDDGGEGAECGSDLTRRQYTIEFFVFGQTLTWARNVASVIKFGLQADEFATLPLYDIEADDFVTAIDQLLVDSVSSERQPLEDPEPWQEFVYTVHLKVTDEYYAHAVAG